jgi:hypothetical protein
MIRLIEEKGKYVIQKRGGFFKKGWITISVSDYTDPKGNPEYYRGFIFKKLETATYIYDKLVAHNHLTEKDIKIIVNDDLSYKEDKIEVLRQD